MQETKSTQEPNTQAWAVISEIINGVLQDIQIPQRILGKVVEGDYDVEVVQQKLGRLTSLKSRIQKMVGTITQLDSETIAAFNTKIDAIQIQLETLLRRANDTDSVLLEKRELQKELYEIVMQLDVILSELAIELDSQQKKSQKVTINLTQRETISNLAAELGEEKQQITLGNLGQSVNSQILYELHRLTLQLYQIRQLAAEPRLRNKVAQLEPLALQMQDTVRGIDIEGGNVVELLEEHIEAIDRQLARFEYDRNFGFIPLRLSWFVNRYRDVTRLKSAQARILSGLGFSFAVSGLIVIAFMVPLTLISTWATTTKDNMRQRLNSELIDEVNQLLNVGNQQAPPPSKRLVLDEEIAKIDGLKTEIRQLISIAASGPKDGNSSGDKIENPKSPTEKLNELEQNYLKGLETTLKSFEQERLNLESRLQTFDNRQKINRTKITGVVTRIEALSDWERQNNLGAMPILTSDQITQLEQELLASVEQSSIFAEIQEDQKTLLKQNIAIAINKKSDQSSLSRILKSLANVINNESFLNHSRRIILAAFAGAIGSMMSILIRLDQIDQENINNPFLLGALKPLIGAVFGVAVFAILSTRVIDILPSSFNLHEPKNSPPLLGGDSTNLSPSEVIISNRDPLGDIDSQELYKIFLLAFIAGFSERLANDTLRSVSANKGF